MKRCLTVSVRKAEGTPNGDGWYYLLSGTIGARELIDVGGQDWYPTAAAAREAGKRMSRHCYFHPQYGWCYPLNVKE